MIDAAARCSFHEQGYLVARGLFDAEETGFLRDHFMRLREAGGYPGDVVGVETGSDDPLKRYPRMIHMHRWDQVALDWLLEPRLAHSLSSLLDGLEPFAVQTMLYFKPPGARGQAVHQDQYYLRAEPGTLVRPGPVIVIGADLPGLRPHHVGQALGMLRRHDAVLGPATDGGFWLIGLCGRRAAPPRLLDGVRWSTEHALADTLARLRHLDVGLAATLRDVDTAGDLRRIR